MTSPYEYKPATPRDLAHYGVARVRDIAFDAVMQLWRIRKQQGMTQAELAAALGRDPGWVSRSLRGPGNWTLKTIGELVAALDGEIEISVLPMEAPEPNISNYRIYDDYGNRTYMNSDQLPIWKNEYTGSSSIKVLHGKSFS